MKFPNAKEDVHTPEMTGYCSHGFILLFLLNLFLMFLYQLRGVDLGGGEGGLLRAAEGGHQTRRCPDAQHLWQRVIRTVQTLQADLLYKWPKFTLIIYKT